MYFRDVRLLSPPNLLSLKLLLSTEQQGMERKRQLFETLSTHSLKILFIRKSYLDPTLTAQLFATAEPLRFAE